MHFTWIHFIRLRLLKIDPCKVVWVAIRKK